jgi:hypothetical protein
VARQPWYWEVGGAIAYKISFPTPLPILSSALILTKLRLEELSRPAITFFLNGKERRGNTSAFENQ